MCLVIRFYTTGVVIFLSCLRYNLLILLLFFPLRVSVYQFEFLFLGTIFLCVSMFLGVFLDLIRLEFEISMLTI